MFKRVKAEPNGNVTFEYGCSTVTVDKNGVSHIRSTLYKKGKNEWFDNLRTNSIKHISNELH